MKNLNYLFLLSFCLLINTSCEKSVSQEFEEINGNVETKLVKSIAVTHAENPSENRNIIFTYDNDNRLSTFSDGINSNIFVYENGSLSNISGQQEVSNAEELYQSPYDAFETGEVTENDDNGNPRIIIFFEEEYNNSTNNYDIVEYKAEFSYDNKPNLYYYTLEAAGIIEVLDRVSFNFSPVLQSQDIVQARTLLPLNNITKIIYKDDKGDLIFSINIDYVYDEQNYPTSATITSSDQYSTSILLAIFQYINI